MTDVRDLTEAKALSWISTSAHLSNNTVRSRITAAVALIDWANDSGLAAIDTRRIRRMRRAFPATFGKVQSTNPARFLTRDEAFRSLTTACQDGTHEGLRDELVIRLGLSGMRAAEIASLTIGDLQLGGTQPCITWIGKMRRARRAVPSARLIAALKRWLTVYADALDRQADSAMPVICAITQPAPGRRIVRWGTPVSADTGTIWRIVQRRAQAAGLGHVAPHDLRRTTAAILHKTRTPDGAHHFDLRDIQQVLGHADPQTTVRSYLDLMDTDVLGRAAGVLD